MKHPDVSSPKPIETLHRKWSEFLETDLNSAGMGQVKHALWAALAGASLVAITAWEERSKRSAQETAPTAERQHLHQTDTHVTHEAQASGAIE